MRKVLFCSYFFIEHMFWISVRIALLNLTTTQNICFFKVLNAIFCIIVTNEQIDR